MPDSVSKSEYVLLRRKVTDHINNKSNPHEVSMNGTPYVSPINQYLADGVYGIDMQNSAIIGLHQLVFRDTAGITEGVFFPKTGASVNSVTHADYNIVRVLDGTLYIDDVAVLEHLGSGVYKLFLDAGGYIEFNNNDELKYNDTTNTYTFYSDGAAANSDVEAGDFVDVCHADTKENIRDFEGSALDIVKSLRVRQYGIKGKKEKRDDRIGFVVEELPLEASVYTEDEKGSKIPRGTSTRAVIGILTKAVQELAGEVSRLKSE